MTNLPPTSSSNNPEARFAELLDLLLANEATPQQKAELQSLAAASPTLAAELKFHLQTAQSLRTAFTPPAAPALKLDQTPTHASSPLGMPRRKIAWFAAAAVLGLATFLGLRLSGVIGGPPPIADGPESPQTIYNRVLAQGFKPQVLCPNDPDSFAKLVKNRLGTEVVPSGLASTIALTGWSYRERVGTPLSPGAIVLLATQGDAKILVFMEKASQDRPLEEPKPPMKLFRRESGPLVFYELTPLDHDVIIKNLSTR